MGNLLCPTCRQQIPRIAPHCVQCQRQNADGRTCQSCLSAFPVDGVVVVGAYATPLLSLAIQELKYRQLGTLADDLSALLIQAIKDRQENVPELQRIDVVLPVPLHAKRLRRRGYNQSALLAQPLAQALGWSCRTDILVRVRYTTPQVELSGQERRHNVTGSFQVKHPEAVAGRHILVVDDVTTTGSTFGAVAAALRQAGAASVWGAALAAG